MVDITWTNAELLPIGLSERKKNFNEIWIELRKLKMLSANWQPFCLNLNVLRPF